jgi:hypothetical protein
MADVSLEQLHSDLRMAYLQATPETKEEMFSQMVAEMGEVATNKNIDQWTAIARIAGSVATIAVALAQELSEEK